MPDDPGRARRGAGKRCARLSAESLGENFWRDPVDVDARIAYQRGGSSMKDQQQRSSIKLRGREPTIQIAEDGQQAPTSDLGSSSVYPRLQIVEACQLI